MLDLDKFKQVNDSLGHHAGDQLLVQVGARLRACLRDVDLLARLGGDEFAVLLDDVGHDAAVHIAAKLGAALDEPFALQDITLHSSVSVGVALFPDDGPDLSTLLRKADIAMYKAKTSLRGHHVYCSANDAHDATRLQTVQELRTALKSDQLVVHYQPKIDLATGDVHSVEALVRWNHPTRGLLYPEVFLDLVEESGLMPAPTRAVLAEALGQVAAWHAQGQPLTVAVNLSASSLGRLRPAQTGRCYARRRRRPTERPAAGDHRRVPDGRPRPGPFHPDPAAQHWYPRSPWTTTAPATTRSATCATCPSTSSSLTARSCVP
jgi:diguanylate cyclase (GGDEF)-like protein